MSENVLVIGAIQARMGSSRLPGKVLAPILGVPMIGRIIERLSQSKVLDAVVIATTNQTSDDKLVEYAQENGTECFRGEVDDIVSRLSGTADAFGAGVIVRIWGDSPLTDPGLIDSAVEKLINEKLDYVCTGFIGNLTFPAGVDIQVYTRTALETIRKNATDPFYHQFPADYILEQRDQFRWGVIENSEDMSDIHMTVDYPEDLDFIRKIYEALYMENRYFTFRETVALIREQAALKSNVALPRNEEYFSKKAIKK